MNPQSLLEQFLGPQSGAAANDKLRSATGALSGSSGKAALGGLAAGGLLGLLMGSKKTRKKVGKLAGGVVGYGGAAALGALAHSAYRKWQDQKAETASAGAAHPAPGHAAPAQRAPASAPPPQSSYVGGPSAAPALATPAADEVRFAPSAAVGRDGRPFELALVRAMISAANADGHLCEEERKTIFSHMSSLNLDADDKSFVFEALMSPSSLEEIAGLADGVEQATEIYLVSRMAIDVDDPAERVYLDTLAQRLALPPELVAELEKQVTAQTTVAA